jgi:nucleoside-diphosphate-sugar epimerase
MTATETQQRPIAITGAAGYIGSVVSQHFVSSGRPVLGLDCLLHGPRAVLPLMANPLFSFKRVDTTRSQDIEAVFRERQPWAVVHLAAIVGDPACRREPERAEIVNYGGSLAVAEAAENFGAHRFIFISTCNNYGIGSEHAELLTEEAELKPLSKYAETKVRAEETLLGRASRAGMSTTILRFSTAHGLSSRMRFDLTVNEFTRDAVMGGGVEIYDADTWRPYCHVTDFGRAIDAALTAPEPTVRGQVFNVGANAENFRKSDLAEFAVKLNPTARIALREGGFDRRNYRVDFSKVHRDLGFTCGVGVKNSMKSIAEALSTGAIVDPYSMEWRNA